MPVYDLRCEECGGIFERLRRVSEVNSPLECPYCHQETSPVTMLTIRPSITVKERWRPSSPMEALAGKTVHGPGAKQGATRNSVLHVCGGKNCSICAV